MQVKKFVFDEHYLICKSWWDSLGGDWIAPAPDVLPKDGFIAYYEDMPIAAIFVYLSSNSSMAYVGWLISNKKSSPSLKGAALIHLDKAVNVFLKEKNIVGAFALAPNNNVESIFTKFGYVPCEKTTVMIKDLK